MFNQFGTEEDPVSAEPIDNLKTGICSTWLKAFDIEALADFGREEIKMEGSPISLHFSF